MKERTHLRRESDRHLRQSEAHLRALAEQFSQLASEESIAFLDAILSTAPIGLGFVDRNLRYVRINETLARINGRPPQDHVGKQIREILPQSMADALEPVYRGIFEAGAPVRNLEVVGETGSGQGKRHWLINYYPVYDRRGEIQWVGSAVLDVTELKEAEDRLRANQASIAKAQEIAHFGSWELDLHNLEDLNANELRWTPECYRVFGVEPGQVKPTNELFFSAVHPDDRPKIVAAVSTALAERRPYSIEHRIVRPDGAERIVHEHATIVYDSQGKMDKLIGTAQDVTELKRTQEALAAMNETLEKQVVERTRQLQAKEAELRQSQKLEAIGRLAGGVAHDFNNLITGILGIAEEVQEALPQGDPHRADLSQIIQAANRASNLTRQLLAFSRRQPAQPKLVNLNQVILDMQTILRPMLREDIALEAVLDPRLGILRADPAQLEQVLINLILNARDAMPNGGRISIVTANALITPEYARQHFDIRPGRYARLEVADTGTGMSPEIAEHIFEPFFTTKPAGQGTGLGLATVYGIVKQNEGDISVYSEPGQGTRFVVYLPQTDAPVEQRAARRERTSQGKETILLVEDEAIVRQVASRALRRCGYTVLEASDGTDALTQSNQRTEPIDLVVTDVIMPGMNGRELVEQLLPRRPGTAVLYMSGYTGSVAALTGGPANAAFLEKSFTPETLCRKVREVLDKKLNQG